MLNGHGHLATTDFRPLVTHTQPIQSSIQQASTLIVGEAEREEGVPLVDRVES